MMARCFPFLVLVLILPTCALSSGEAPALANGFAGWQDLRVVRLEDAPPYLAVGDADGDGRDEALIMDARNARLVCIEWMPVKERPGSVTPTTQVNEIPMAREFARSEIPIEGMPAGVAILSWPGGPGPRVVAVSRRGELLIFATRAPASGQARTWTRERSLRLLRSNPVLHLPPILWPGTEGPVLLVACTDGVQVVPLNGDARPAWLRPQETLIPSAWWTCDLDGDGHADLVEEIHGTPDLLRWRRNRAGVLAPAQVVEERDLRQVACLRQAKGSAVLAILPDGNQTTLRLARMSAGKPHRFGRRNALPVPGQGIPWAGMSLAGRPALVVVDKAHPQFQVFPLADDTWEAGVTYPCINKVKGLASVAAVPGLLLVCSEEDGDLFRTTWQDGRLGFPTAWVLNPKASDRKVVGLGRTGDTTWWVQKQDEDLVLMRWGKGQAEPVATVFPKSGGKTAKAQWVGRDRLLAEDAYARNPFLLVLDQGAVTRRELTHLGKVAFEDWRVVADGEVIRLGRLAEGVLQWLDDDLKPCDQVMLDPGRRLADLLLADPGRWWGLEADGFMHRLQADGSGVLRVAETIEVPTALRGVVDPVLGVLLLGEREVIRLSEGPVRELSTLATADARTGMPATAQEAVFDRVLPIADGSADLVLLTDDRRHQSTLLRPEADRLVPLASWPVFENRNLPYGRMDPKAQQQPEPRAAASADLDGDDRRDLLLLCHDRLLIYLGRRETTAGGTP